jgi:23S rRNA pseudouridine2605 synthase
MTEQRLQKLLAAAGYGSRRTCEKFISAGRVRVNGRVAKIGEKADPDRDTITIDGQTVAAAALKYAILNKPRGVVSSLNAQGDRPTVRDLVSLRGRLYPVGRLDMDSEGLVLMTNDGDLANLLTHPRYGHEKEYEVLVDGHPKDEQLQSWRRGVVLDGEWTNRTKVKVFRKGASGTWLRITMREGRKHQIRRTAETLGLRVKKLIRVRFGNLRLGNLESGDWRELRPDEVLQLKSGSRKPRPKKPPGRKRR